MSATRRRGREFTLQLLYQFDLRKVPLDEILTTAWKGAGSHPSERRFAESEAMGVIRHMEELDALIVAKARNWKLARMSVIDRNLLRLGAYEILYAPDIPDTVTINECIELGKTYSAQESGAFINAILDKIAQENKKAKPKAKNKPKGDEQSKDGAGAE